MKNGTNKTANRLIRFYCLLVYIIKMLLLGSKFYLARFYSFFFVKLSETQSVSVRKLVSFIRTGTLKIIKSNTMNACPFKQRRYESNVITKTFCKFQKIVSHFCFNFEQFRTPWSNLSYDRVLYHFCSSVV